MSLHDSASQVQSAGRGDDKVLVHMTPGEVSGLQSLAMAHGGSLTINPHTGLPEAGFLSSLLPMAIGFGLAPFTGGLSAALITGAGYTAATGSLKKGIMAGLGAYGGAGLAGGLSSMGAQASQGAGIGVNAANAGATVGARVPSHMLANTANVVDDAALANLNTFGANTGTVGLNTGLGANAGIGLNTGFGANAGIGLNTNYANLAPQLNAMPLSNAQIAANSQIGNAYGNLAPISPPTPTKPFTAADLPSAISGKPYPYDVVAKTTSDTVSRPFTDYMSQVKQGAKNVYAGGVDGLGALADAMPKYSITAGLTGTAGTYAAEKREEMEDEMRKRKNALDTGMIRPYEFDYGATNVASEPYSGSGERTYFQPTYTALTPYKAPGPEYKAAEGGLTSLAVGGPVEQMSAMNAIGANTGYPQARLQTPLYSNPMMQRPEAMNVIAPSVDAGVNTYSGEARFADGGETQYGRSISSGGAKPNPVIGRGGVTPVEQEYGAPSGYKYTYDPDTMQFTQTAGPGAKPSNKDLALGVGAQDMHRRFVESQITGQPYNSTPSWAKSGATPNGPVSGGVATPMMQPQSPAQPLIPNVDVPAYQTPEQQLGLGGFYDYMNQQMGGYGGYAAGGGVSHLGDYSDGGRLLKGPGDGVSDSIPASIGNRQPARLADGEFVVPARIVSEIGNGSTEAGARKLYAMMDRVQRARKKTTGKNQVARNTKAEKLLPA